MQTIHALRARNDLMLALLSVVARRVRGSDIPEIGEEAIAWETRNATHAAAGSAIRSRPIESVPKAVTRKRAPSPASPWAWKRMRLNSRR